MNRIGLNWSLLYSKKITESELRVFLVMKDRAYCVSKDCEKPFYVTVGWIATNTGLHTNTVKAAIKSLKDMKLIGTNGRVRKYGVVQNEWTINWPLIEKDDKHHKFVNEEVDVDIDVIPAPEEDCALEPTEIAKNEVCMQQFELDPIVDGEIDEDDCRYKEYMAGLNKDTVELSQRKSIPTEAEIMNLLAQGYTEADIMNKYIAA